MHARTNAMADAINCAIATSKPSLLVYEVVWGIRANARNPVRMINSVAQNRPRAVVVVFVFETIGSSRSDALYGFWSLRSAFT